MTLQTTAIEVTGVAKSYGDQAVLHGIDLTVPTGTVYALLGPNGAGKTTMIRILTTLTAADEGVARIAGFDVKTEPDGVRRSIGVTGQFSAVDELLTGRENLRLMADLAHLRSREAVARVDELLARFGIADAADRRAATYSGGMKRRLDLAMTLVSRPRLIFLDEPTTGLDPRSRRDLWQIVRELLADGVTIFLTTQYLEEADHLAHNVGLLDGGRVVATGNACRAQGPGRRGDARRRVPGAHRSRRHHRQRPRRNGECPMTTLTYATRDSATMLRRNLKHLMRYPSLTLTIIGMPVVFLLLFVYVFGGTMGAGLPGGDGRADYLTYITPTILVMTVVSVSNSTAIMVAKDATEGIIDRFRTMPITRSSPLTGHALAAMAQTILGVLVVLAVALALGYRTSTSLAGLAGAAGMILLLGWAVTWLCVALGLASGSVEAASNAPLPLILLPFLSSGFVPTDSMPPGLAWIAENQPFTPIIDTLRACLEGRDPGSDAWWAIGWCVLITVLSFGWAGRLFGRVRAV